MDKHFYIFSESWYADANAPLRNGNIKILDDVMFGDESGEMKMQWVELDTPSAQLCAFEDSWQFFEKWPALFAGLKKLGNPSVKQFVAFLLDNGFEDQTKREGPYKPVYKQHSFDGGKVCTNCSLHKNVAQDTHCLPA